MCAVNGRYWIFPKEIVLKTSSAPPTLKQYWKGKDFYIDDAR